MVFNDPEQRSEERLDQAKGVIMPEELPRHFFTRGFVKTFLRRSLALATLVGLFYGLSALVYATRAIFKVKMNYAVVLERFGGQREAITDIGWHVRLPYFTRIEQEVSLMNQTTVSERHFRAHENYLKGKRGALDVGRADLPDSGSEDLGH